jgi:hypothetical protein
MTTTNPPARVALALLALGLVWTLGTRAADAVPVTERFVRLEAAGSVLTLDRDAGYALSSWIDYSGLARQLLVPGKSGLVGLGFTRAGDTSGELWRVASTQAESSTCELRTDATGTTASIHFNRLGGKDIHAICTVSVRGGLVSFRVEVTGREALVLEELQCPVVEVAAPLGRSLDDTCYGSTHGHPPGHGLWDAEAYNRQLADLRQACDRVAPGSVLCQEQPQELFLRHFQLFDYRESLTASTRPEVELASVFAYLYHDVVPLFANGEGVGHDPLRTGWGLVNGEIPIFFPTSLTLAGQPLVGNGGFEDWRGTALLGWLGQDGRPDRDVVHGGRTALRLGGAPGGALQAKVLLRVDGTELTAGRVYRLRLWLRTQAADAATEQVNLTAYDQPPDADYHLWKALGRWVIQLHPSAEWQERRVEFTVPAGAQTVDLMLRGQPGGTAWFDDLILEERSADGTWREVCQVESGAMALLRQWVPLLCAAESRPFLLHGRMLRPPPMRTETTSFSYSRKLADPQPKIMVQVYNDLLSPQGAWNASLPADASDWQRLEIGFSLPPGATQLHLFLPLDVQGTFWFDDVRLEQSGAAGNRLANGSFEAWPPAAAMPDGWTFWSRDAACRTADVVSREGTGAHEGQTALRLIFATPAPGVQFKQQIDIHAAGIEPDRPCTLSLWVRSTGAVRADSEKLTRTAPAVLHNRFQAPDGREALVLANVTAAPRLATVEWRGKEMPVSLRPWEAKLELLP